MANDALGEVQAPSMHQKTFKAKPNSEKHGHPKRVTNGAPQVGKELQAIMVELPSLQGLLRMMMGHRHLSTSKAKTPTKGVNNGFVIGTSPTFQNPRHQGGCLPVVVVAVKMEGVVDDVVVLFRSGVGAPRKAMTEGGAAMGGSLT